MTKMRTACRTAHLHANAWCKRAIFDQFNCITRCRRIERRPATTGVELGLTAEEFSVARLARVDAHGLGVGVLANERLLGCSAAQHLKGEFVHTRTQGGFINHHRIRAAHHDLWCKLRREAHPRVGVAVVALRVLLQVALVILLGLPELVA